MEYLYLLIFAAIFLWLIWSFYRSFRPDAPWKGNRIRVLFLTGFVLIAGHMTGAVVGSSDFGKQLSFRDLFLKNYAQTILASGDVSRGSLQMARDLDSPGFLQEMKSLNQGKQKTGDVLFYAGLLLLLFQLIILYPIKKIPREKQIALAKMPLIPILILFFAGKELNTAGLASEGKVNLLRVGAKKILTGEIPRIGTTLSAADAVNLLTEERNRTPVIVKQLPSDDFILALYPSVKAGPETKAVLRQTDNGYWVVIDEKDRRSVFPLPAPQKDAKYQLKSSGSRLTVTAGGYAAAILCEDGIWKIRSGNVSEVKK